MQGHGGSLLGRNLVKDSSMRLAIAPQDIIQPVRCVLVVTKDADRLSRDIGQLFGLLDMFQRAEVRVQFSTPEGANAYKFLEVFSAAVAQLSTE